MKRETAEQLMRELEHINALLNDVGHRVHALQDQSEDVAFFLRATASSSLQLYRDAMRPIIRTYPDLDPDAEYLRERRAQATAAAPKPEP